MSNFPRNNMHTLYISLFNNTAPLQKLKLVYSRKINYCYNINTFILSWPTALCNKADC